VVFSLDAGAPVTGYSYSDLWVRVSDATGRTGWVFHSLIDRR
jgi:SH3-like domain-containing protein